MKPNSKRIAGCFFLLSGIIILISGVNTNQKKSKTLKTVIVAQNIRSTYNEEEYYFGGNAYAEKSWDINLNQTGYRPEDDKVAVIRDNSGRSTYQIMDESGNTVYTGNLTKGYTDTDYNETLYYADFSKYRKEGTYYLACGEQVYSSVFEIEKDLYENIASQAAKSLDMESSLLTSTIFDDNAEDVYKDKQKNDLDVRSRKAKLISSGEEKDVSGGWYSENGGGWYVIPSVTALANLAYLKSYDEAQIRKLSGWKSTKIDKIMKAELDWLLKMQEEESGGIYHKAATEDGEMHEDSEILISGVSTAATADAAAILAKASVLFESEDADLAAKYLKAAEKAWSYLEEHPENRPFSNEPGVTSLEYSDDSDQDERFWAAMELYLATGEEKYRKQVRAYELNQAEIDFGCQDVAGYALVDYYSKTRKTSSPFYKEVEALLVKEAKEIEDSTEQGYRINPGYAASTMQYLLNRSLFLTLMEKKTGNKDLAPYIQKYLDYVMGENPKSQNAFQGLLSGEKEPSLEAASALLVIMQGMKQE